MKSLWKAIKIKPMPEPPESFLKATDEDLITEAQTGTRGQGANVEMMRRLRDVIEKFDASTTRYNRILIGLTVAIGSLTLIQVWTVFSPPHQKSETDVSHAAAAALDKGQILAHKAECMKIGAQAKKNQSQDGLTNTTENLNQGLMYFDWAYSYSESFNTCLALSGFEQVNLKTKTSVAFQATITDLLNNKVLATYFVLNGENLAPVSMERHTFTAKVRELFGEPIPKWLELGPHSAGR
jgi:hypothetical protein